MMKKLLTEHDILDRIKQNTHLLVIEKGTVITPLALDRIKRAGMKVLFEDPARREDVFAEVKQNAFFPVIAVGSDHTGYKMKLEISKYLQAQGITVIDTGCYNEDSCDYPDFAAAVCAKIHKSEAAGGMLFDATGIPSAITANKYSGIRAATCYNEFTAHSARSHNNANVLVVGARTLGIETVLSIAKKFITTSFEGGRHQRRLDKITQIEELRK